MRTINVRVKATYTLETTLELRLRDEEPKLDTVQFEAQRQAKEALKNAIERESGVLELEVRLCDIPF